MEVGAAGCLGVVGAAGSLVVVVAVKASLACPEASSALGSACPCSSVSLQLLHLEPLAGEGVRQKDKQNVQVCRMHPRSKLSQLQTAYPEARQTGACLVWLAVASPVGRRVMFPGF